LFLPLLYMFVRAWV